MTVLRAKLVAPMAGPVIVDGAVAFEDARVVAVGRVEEVLGSCRDAEVIDYGTAVILPGLVNAHTHLELSLIKRPEQPGTFQDWVLATGAQLPHEAAAARKNAADATQTGVRASLRFGVTTLGDISRHAAASRGVLSASPMTAVSFGECLGLEAVSVRFEALLAAARDIQHVASNVRVGVSPHAPYTVNRAGYAAALATGLPLCTHLAETRDEARFLVDHGGLFGALYERLGVTPAPAPPFAGGPIRFATALGLLTQRRVLLAHVNYCDDSELDELAHGTASVAYCPRTHAYFRHPPHRFTDMLARGVNVCVGTDSVASSPDLNVVAELREIRRQRPDVPAETLWQMATTNGAAALMLEDEVGSLAAGKQADVCVIAGAGFEDALSGEMLAVYARGRLIKN